MAAARGFRKRTMGVRPWPRRTLYELLRGTRGNDSDRGCPMTKDVTLSLDDFSRHAVDRFTRLGTGSPADAVRTASLYYLREREADRPGWRVPRFAAAQQAGHPLTVELDDATWNALAGE